MEELGLTRLFNAYLAGPANALLGLFGITAKDPTHPWENWIVVEILVAVLLMVVAALLKAGLSADKPGALQHVFEGIYGFIKNLAEEAGIHHGERYVPFIGTIFIFITVMNLIGMIPAFEAPTMSPWVPAGIAVPVFLYYNAQGFRENGIGYLKHFAGPIWWIAWLMLPIELVSHFIRPLTLTVRLYGNMFAGEQVTQVFLSLTKLVIPIVFMCLHIFVALVQAFVFTLLTTIYIAMATAHEH